MALTVKVAEAKARLSELLAKVEAGEQVIISRVSDPIAGQPPGARPGCRPGRGTRSRPPGILSRWPRSAWDEILEWKAEGRR